MTLPKVPTNVTLVGLLGGVASGKSLVAQQLAELGAVVIDADKLGHQVLTQPEVIAEIRQNWSDAVLTADGQVARQKLAAIVFAPSPAGQAALAALERITHPRIRALTEARLVELAAAGTPVVAVLDAPVMLKAGWHHVCQRLIFVDAPQPVRLTRAKTRGWSEAEFLRREARQEPVEFKRKLCDTVIENAGSVEQTAAQVRQFWASLG